MSLIIANLSILAKKDRRLAADHQAPSSPERPADNHLDSERAASRKSLVDGISGCFSSGTITLVVGASGAGKSTLLQCVAGLHSPDSGTIHIDDLALYQGLKPRREALLRVGYVAQFPEEQLFASTVRKEIRYSLKPYRLSGAEESKRIDAALIAGGISPEMGEHSPLTLSGGQKRRVAMASSIAPRTPWLIMDEPTAGLDAAAMKRMLAMLSQWQDTESTSDSRPDGGVVIASHHIGSMLPYVDSVWMLKDGRLLGIYSAPQVLERPDLLEQAGIGVPEELRLRAGLRLRGIVIPATHFTPKEVAAAILASHRQESPLEHDGSGAVNPLQTQAHDYPGPVSSSPRVHLGTNPISNPLIDSQRTGTNSRIDPRAKWAFFTCLTAGLFVQNSWIGLGVFALVLFLAIRFARVHFVSLARTLSPILWLMIFSVLFSGLKFGLSHTVALGMDWHRAATTLRGVCEFALAIGVGSLIPATMTPLEMKRGLELSLRGLSRLGVPVEAVSLSLTLILRFLPLLSKEVARFCIIATARAKIPAKPGRLRPSSLPSAIIPLLLAVLRLGEDFALALEARGQLDFRSSRMPVALPMNRPSVALMLLGVVVFVGLLSLRLL